jgi:putative transposase
VLGVSVSGYYEAKGRPVSVAAAANEVLLGQIRAAHEASFGTYGARRVHAELRLGLGVAAGVNRVERLMRVHHIHGVHYRRRRGCTRRNPAQVPAGDVVERAFHPDGPDRLWVADITEHPTAEGKVYIAAVIDAWSRRVVGYADVLARLETAAADLDPRDRRRRWRW